MMRDDDDTRDNDDDLLPRLFRALGPRPALPDDMRAGWQSTFARELSSRNALRRRARFRYIAAAGASLAALWIAALFVPGDAPRGAPIATVAMATGDVESGTAAAPTRLHDGDELFSGQTLRTGENAYAALRIRGTDVRLNSGTTLVLQPTRVQLLRGDIYIDADPKHQNAAPLTIETVFGTLAHVGTQFMVSVGADEMHAAVREGSFVIDAAGERRTVSAADGPTEAVISSRGTVTTRPITATGGPWKWVVEAAPGYSIDGRSADEFLVWATRQLGAELNYATKATHHHAQSVVLHSGPRRLSVREGLEVLSATTDLDIDQSDPAVMRVHTRRS